MISVSDDLFRQLDSFLSRISASCRTCPRSRTRFCEGCDLRSAAALRLELAAAVASHEGERKPSGFYPALVRQSLEALGGHPGRLFVSTRRIHDADGRPIPTRVYRRMAAAGELELRELDCCVDDIGPFRAGGYIGFAVRLA